MKKQGFTLVELLAVIVVLAIIALIAVPTIIGVVDKSKQGALQDSAYGLIQAANLYYAEYGVSGTARFDIMDNVQTTEEKHKLSYKGTISSGTVLINSKGKITVCLNQGNYSAYKNFGDTKVTTVNKKSCTVPENSSVVYLDSEATVTELTNQELTEEIEDLKKEIAELKENKADKTTTDDLSETVSNKADTSALKNLQGTHTSDINSINNRLGNASLTGIGNGTITGAISTLNNELYNAFHYVSFLSGTLKTNNPGLYTSIWEYTATKNEIVTVSASIGNEYGDIIVVSLWIDGAEIQAQEVYAHDCWHWISVGGSVYVKTGQKVIIRAVSVSNTDLQYVISSNVVGSMTVSNT